MKLWANPKTRGMQHWCASAGTERQVSLTFPRATADVAMSRTKLSPSFAGAATAMGLVPKVHWTQAAGQRRHQDEPLKVIYSVKFRENFCEMMNEFTSLPRVGTTSGDVFVNDMPCRRQIIIRQTEWNVYCENIRDLHLKRLTEDNLQSCFPSEQAKRSVLQYRNGWSLRKRIQREKFFSLSSSTVKLNKATTKWICKSEMKQIPKAALIVSHLQQKELWSLLLC